MAEESPMMDLEKAREKLTGSPPSDVVAWAVDHFDKIAMTSSFQTQSLPLLHIVSKSAPEVPILFLDTGYHFPQTLEFRDEVVERLGLNLRVLRGDKSAERAAQDSPHPLHSTDPDTCCFINKVEPLGQALEEYEAWISGVRRDQTDNREGAKILERTDQVIRVHPMLTWTEDDVDAYIDDHDLPEHPLSDHGFESIGCAPCTRRPEGEKERSGRWAGQDKTECGLHTDLRSTNREDD